MVAWYTPERIVELFFQAESLGLNVCLCRGDDHITGVLKRYWDQGGTMRWIAQTVSQQRPRREQRATALIMAPLRVFCMAA